MIRFPRHLLFASLSTALALSLGACASSQDDTAPSAPPASALPATPGTSAPEAPSATAPGDASARCNADAAQSFIGQDASDTTVGQAQAAAGATGAVRVIKPGQPVTMDYRADRLNVEVDDHNAIVRITCG
jgi:hypothetical protein